MKRENKKTLVALIKIKKLTISEITKVQKSFKKNDQVSKLYSSLIHNNKLEIKIITYVVKSEEKNNGS